jgi:hypothetical protein
MPLSNNKSYTYEHYSDLLCLLAIVFITYYAYPSSGTVSSEGKVTMQAVGYYGWVTAVSTGLGILPFLFVKNPNSFWMGVSNGLTFPLPLPLSVSLSLSLISSLHSSRCWDDDCCLL